MLATGEPLPQGLLTQAALMPSSAQVHLGWVVRRLAWADGYITASSQEVCLELFGRPTFALEFDRLSDGFCVESVPRRSRDWKPLLSVPRLLLVRNDVFGSDGRVLVFRGLQQFESGNWRTLHSQARAAAEGSSLSRTGVADRAAPSLRSGQAWGIVPVPFSPSPHCDAAGSWQCGCAPRAGRPEKASPCASQGYARGSPHTRTRGAGADDGPAGCGRLQQLQARLRRAQQYPFSPEPLCSLCRDVGWVLDGNAQGEEASFLRQLVLPPDIRAKIRDPGTGIAPSSMIKTREFRSGSCALRRGDGVKVVEERCEEFILLELALAATSASCCPRALGGLIGETRDHKGSQTFVSHLWSYTVGGVPPLENP